VLRHDSTSERATEQSVTVRRLRRVRAQSLVMQHGEDVDQLSGHARRIASFIYAMKCKAEWAETLLETADYYAKKGIERLDQVDAIVIHGRGILRNFKAPNEYAWAGGPAAGKVGWVFEGWGPDTLAGFLFHLNSVYACVTPLGQPVVSHYITGANVPVKEVEPVLDEVLVAWRSAKEARRLARPRVKRKQPPDDLSEKAARRRGKPGRK
jgi:hypothetical protein